MPLMLFSQTVSVTFFNIPQQKVYLNAYTGLYIEMIDSVMMSQDKRAEFNSPMKKGMYQIETELGYTVDFLYEETPVKMVVADVDDRNCVDFLDSKINVNWSSYISAKEKTITSLNMLKPILRDYDKESDFYINAKNEYQKIQSDFIAFTDSLLTYDNYASTLIRVDRFFPLDLDDDFATQRKDLISNYFNDVDFNDLSLMPTNVLTTKIIDFLSIQQTAGQTKEQQIMSFILGIDNVLYRATVNCNMYKFIFQYLIELFNELKVNDVVDYMTGIPYSEFIDCSERQYDELLSIAEFNSRARIGSTAKNIFGKTISEDDFNMYDIDTEYTIVFFWSYTCDHCRENIKEFKKIMDENPDMSLVAVCVIGDLKKIKKLINNVKVKGYFYHDGLEWDCPFVSDYAVVSTPSFFVLDKDKRILYKPFDFNELVNYINLNIKR